jgi:hypothetical protein
MPRDVSFRFWKYMYNREIISNELMDKDIPFYAPEIMVLRKRSDYTLHQAMVLSDGVGYLIPSSCDAFLVNPHSPRLRFVQGNLIRERFGDRLCPVTIIDQEFLSLSLEDSGSLSTLIQDLPSEEVSGFEIFTPGLWIDAE